MLEEHRTPANTVSNKDHDLSCNALLEAEIEIRRHGRPGERHDKPGVHGRRCGRTGRAMLRVRALWRRRQHCPAGCARAAVVPCGTVTVGWCCPDVIRAVEMWLQPTARTGARHSQAAVYNSRLFLQRERQPRQ